MHQLTIKLKESADSDDGRITKIQGPFKFYEGQYIEFVENHIKRYYEITLIKNKKAFGVWVEELGPVHLAAIELLHVVEIN